MATAISVDDGAPHWSGSLVSAFVGWLTFCLTAIVCSAGSPERLGGFIATLAVLGIVTFFVWLCVLLPLYVMLSAELPLWRWWLCAPCGTAAGTLIGCTIFVALDPRGVFERPLAFVGANFVLGGIIGGVTCLFGSLTAPWFRRLGPFRPGVMGQMLARRRTGFRHASLRCKTWFVEWAGQ